MSVFALRRRARGKVDLPPLDLIGSLPVPVVVLADDGAVALANAAAEAFLNVSEAALRERGLSAGFAANATVLLLLADARSGGNDVSAFDVDIALATATTAAANWAATSPADRAAMLDAAADRLEADGDRLLTLLVREAGKTCANAVSEVREAVDFLRYYAQQVRRDFDNVTHVALGPVVCISPWNFPLAIFTGQVAAALAAGNTVLAKPAEQTPLVAAEAVRALHAAGVPAGVLQLLPGRGETVGAALVADARVQAVLFTGSTEVARLLQRTLAARLGAHGRPVPFIAETGGQNAMVVDSSALVEQVVADVDGQRPRVADGELAQGTFEHLDEAVGEVVLHAQHA